MTRTLAARTAARASAAARGDRANLVITEWDWSRPDKYLHDLISSDKREPSVNANGRLEGGSAEALNKASSFLDSVWSWEAGI